MRKRKSNKIDILSDGTAIIYASNTNTPILVDAEDLPKLESYVWHTGIYGYAMNKNGNSKRILMHRLLINTPDGLFTDHINGNRVDNRKCNLRVVTKKENNNNKVNKHSTGFTGVSETYNGKYLATINFKGKNEYLGIYATLEEAVLIRYLIERVYYGDSIPMPTILKEIVNRDQLGNCVGLRTLL